MTHYNRYDKFNVDPFQFNNQNKTLNQRNSASDIQGDINRSTDMQGDINRSTDMQGDIQFSLKQEPDIKYEQTCNYLVVNSKDRDVTNYPKSNSFVFNFETEYRNVISVELIQAIIPDKNFVTNEPFLLLKIKELENVMDSIDKHIQDSFAILQLAPPTTPGTFIQIDKRIHENVVAYYKTPKALLSKFTISITYLDGTPFEFGGDTTINKQYQSTFIFKITTSDRNTSILNNRRVY